MGCGHGNGGAGKLARARLAEFKAWLEGEKLARAREIVFAMSRRSAKPWPNRRESDEQFRQLWLALEREASMPRREWEPDDGEPVVCPTFDLDIDDPGHGDASAITAAERARLVGWLALASPMARIVAKALGKPPGARPRRGFGEDA